MGPAQTYVDSIVNAQKRSGRARNPVDTMLDTPTAKGPNGSCQLAYRLTLLKETLTGQGISNHRQLYCPDEMPTIDRISGRSPRINTDSHGRFREQHSFFTV
jgi:hypothetical protein